MGMTKLGEIDWKDHWKHRKKDLLYCFMKMDYRAFRDLYKDRAFSLGSFVELLFRNIKSKELAKTMADKIIEHRQKSIESNIEYNLDFRGLCSMMGTPVSSTWNVYNSLLKAGILDRTSKKAPIRLSTKFGSMLRDMSYWYDLFIERSGFRVQKKEDELEQE